MLLCYVIFNLSTHLNCLITKTLTKKGCRNSTPTGAIWLSVKITLLQHTSQGPHTPWFHLHSEFNRIYPWAIIDRKCNAFFVHQSSALTIWSKLSIYYSQSSAGECNFRIPVVNLWMNSFIHLTVHSSQTYMQLYYMIISTTILKMNKS